MVFTLGRVALNFASEKSTSELEGVNVWQNGETCGSSWDIGTNVVVGTEIGWSWTDVFGRPLVKIGSWIGISTVEVISWETNGILVRLVKMGGGKG